MRIAICGPRKQEVIQKVENAFNTQAKTPWEVNETSTIIDYAAETYKYFNEGNVVFDGSVFDFLANNNVEGYDDVYEQIALNSLMNLDYIAVITMDMDKNTQKMYEEYAQMLPGKIYVYSTPAEFELRIR